MLSMSTATFGLLAEDFSRGHQTARARHGAIHDDNGRVELPGQLNGFVAVAGLAHHFDRLVVFEHAAEAAAHEAVIVGEQDGDLRVSHERPPGTLMRTRVPPWAGRRNSMRAAHERRALAHGDDAEAAAAGCGGEAGSVVFDFELEDAAGDTQTNDGPLRAGMAGHIAQ